MTLVLAVVIGGMLTRTVDALVEDVVMPVVGHRASTLVAMPRRSFAVHG